MHSLVPFLLLFLICSTGEFFSYMKYVRALDFADEPDYNYLQNLLNRAFKGTGEVDDGVFDWMKNPQ